MHNDVCRCTTFNRLPTGLSSSCVCWCVQLKLVQKENQLLLHKVGLVLLMAFQQVCTPAMRHSNSSSIR